jgi:hypothetical protein
VKRPSKSVNNRAVLEKASTILNYPCSNNAIVFSSCQYLGRGN